MLVWRRNVDLANGALKAVSAGIEIIITKVPKVPQHINENYLCDKI